MVRVLVVDDSAFARTAISRVLSADPRITIAGIARDGAEAVEQVKSLRPDVVTLDVEMPRLNGLAALTRIMRECPTPVVMLSSLTGPDTDATLKALELGAVDFFLKTSVSAPAIALATGKDLPTTVRMAARARIGPVPSNGRRPARIPIGSMPFTSARRGSVANRVLVIGASTGGPKALAELLPALPRELPASILIVQHMPAGFTTSFAERLDKTSDLTVREASDGDSISRGVALLAPGGYHMRVEKSGKVTLNQEPPVCGVRPAVNVTMISVAKAFGRSSLGVVLTGMGADGTVGAAAIRAAGGEVAAEHESTCTVYGMPKSVVDSGNATRVVPLRRMARHIVEMCS